MFWLCSENVLKTSEKCLKVDTTKFGKKSENFGKLRKYLDYRSEKIGKIWRWCHNFLDKARHLLIPKIWNYSENVLKTSEKFWNYSEIIWNLRKTSEIYRTNVCSVYDLARIHMIWRIFKKSLNCKILQFHCKKHLAIIAAAHDCGKTGRNWLRKK